MKMEFMAEFTEGISRDRARLILKRHRTTRHKPSSSFFGMHSSTSGSDSDHCLIDSIDQSVVTSSKEDEDMANCLIMLARSGSPVTKEEKSDPIRRKFVEIDSTKEKSGCYVYECKTCNRTFPSFQALGGHRASHKKPKVNVEEKKPNMEYVEEQEDEDINNYNDNKKAVVEEEEDDEENKGKSIVITSNNNNNNINHKSPSQTRIISNNMKATKVHECSICGSEFLSGQALGGHMRKHRPIAQSNNNNRTGVSTTSNDSSGGDHQVAEKSPAMLSLDLNFPPPEVVEDRRSAFPFTGGSVFSTAPAFVDCHY